ncbi:MAG: hypothetical protein ACPGO3_09565 [Magnetospiraceae bacterium]
MADTPPNDIIETQSAILTDAIVEGVVDHLTNVAREKGGTLQMADIHALAAEWKANRDPLTEVFRRSIQTVLRARDRAYWSAYRTDPFVRHLVKNFAHLLPDPNNGTLAEGGLSRRLLPGFLHAMTMMLGEETHQILRERSRDTLSRVRDLHGDYFSWDNFYADPDARMVVMDALMAIMPHFTDPHRRASWFCNVVNANLSEESVVTKEGPLAESWTMDEAGFFRLMDALFFELRTALGNPKTRETLERRYGGRACQEARGILKALESARPRG